MWFAILGPLLVHDGEALVPLPRGRQRVLLAALLVHAGSLVQADALAEMVWDGAPPPGAAVTLRSHVLRLRRALGAHAGARLITRNPGYLLAAGNDEVDLLRFRCLCRDGGALVREGAWERAHALLSEALGLWRGDPLADIPSESLRRDECQGLEALRLQAEEWRTAAGLNLGRHHELIPGLQLLAARHPLQEHFHCQLMLALYRCGRQAEALTAYQRARDVLVAELGIEPGPGLRDLHRQILSADPALTLGETARASGEAAHAPGVPAQARRAGAQRVTPQELPAAVPGFTGRSAELRALTDMLDRPDEQAPGAVVISAIDGTAGVGKTALAVHWAHRVAGRFPDGQLYVNLRGYDPGQPVSAADALAGFLRGLGVPGREIPAGTDERAGRFRSLLAGKRVLVVLDNAGQVEQVRPLLPGTPTCAAIVTSRDALAGLVARDGAIRIDLRPLPPEDAAELLTALIGRQAIAEPAAVAALAVQCCQLPLALRLAAEMAIAHPGGSLADLVAQLGHQQRRLDLLDAAGDPRTAVRAVLSWSYRCLDADAARAFRLASLHPGPDLAPDAAAALLGCPAEHAARLLGLLARAQVLQPTAPGRYGMHDLLHGYALELAAEHDGEEDRHAALARLLDYYLQTAAAATDALYPAERHHRPRVVPASSAPPFGRDPAAARNWLDAERPSLVAIVTHAAASSWPRHATGLARTLFRYLHVGGYFPEAIAVYSQARDAARRTGDRSAEAEVLNNLGSAELRQGRYRQAARCQRQALALYRDLDDRPGQARALGDLGTIEYYLGEYQQSAGHQEQAAAIFRETADQSGQATALSGLGNIYDQQGRYEQAAQQYREALALYREANDRTGEGRVLGNLGILDRNLGHYELAASHFRQALGIFRQTGALPNEALALSQLGIIEQLQGRHAEAASYLRRAYAMHQRAGSESGQADTLNALGDALLAEGQASEAQRQYVTALRLASKIGLKHDRARAYRGLGRVHQRTGSPDEAREHLRRALALYIELGVPEAEEVRALLAEAEQAAPAAPSAPVPQAHEPGDS